MHNRIKKQEAIKRLRDWLYNPKTPVFAWKELSLREIANVVGVSYTQVRCHLPPLVAKKFNVHIDKISEARYASAVVQKKQGVKLPKTKIEQIRELRKTQTITETAKQLGLSPSTVQRYSNNKK